MKILIEQLIKLNFNHIENNNIIIKYRFEKVYKNQLYVINILTYIHINIYDGNNKLLDINKIFTEEEAIAYIRKEFSNEFRKIKIKKLI